MTGNAKYVTTWLKYQDPETVWEVKEAKKKRSLTQNSSYWVLIGQLGKVLNLGNHELHLAMLRDYSTPEEVVTRPEVDLLKYMKYAEVEEQTDRWTKWLVYKGSSDMDTKEFTRLLDGLIQTCKDVGIETMTPAELALLRRE